MATIIPCRMNQNAPPAKPAKIADIAVFNSETVKDKATFDNPHQLATGFEHVLVSGIPVVEDGRHTGARPGVIIRS